MKRKIAFLLCLLMVSSQALACGSEASGSQDTTSSDTTTAATTAAEPEYEYADLDLGGADFNILNVNAGNDYYMIDVEMSGDILDDAVWKRNETVEEKYNFNLVEVGMGGNDLNTTVRNVVMAGDNVYQAAYLRTDTLGGVVSDGLLWDLNEGVGFQFDEPWWDHAVMEDMRIGDNEALYFASSDISLHNFEMSWCMYFNRNMITNLQLDLPYHIVKEGKWTYDKLYEYVNVGHNLNGDESYTFNANGNAVYGFTSMSPDCITQAFISCGEKYVRMEDNTPTFTAGTDKYYAVAEKLAKVFAGNGIAHFGNTTTDGSHYELVFGAGRAMFVGSEIKSGDGGGRYADMTDDYGIVPMPKFDEDQENYISPVALWTYFLTIPSSNPDIETASYVLDALAYLSYKDVVPAYYDVTLSVKNIRDEETAEMLDIIRSTRTYLTAYAFGWGSDLRSKVATSVRNGAGDLASIIATQKTKVETEIDASLEAFASK
ncbi:MAG: hypothetical protein IJ493_11410 [Clostridia bacterium]|nr:hypothetical protein [Clostridia bacterium]